jgi:hypothetical protein
VAYQQRHGWLGLFKNAQNESKSKPLVKEFGPEMPRLSSNAHDAMAMAERVTLHSNILPVTHRSPAYVSVCGIPMHSLHGAAP